MHTLTQSPLEIELIICAQWRATHGVFSTTATLANFLLEDVPAQEGSASDLWSARWFTFRRCVAACSVGNQESQELPQSSRILSCGFVKPQTTWQLFVCLPFKYLRMVHSMFIVDNVRDLLLQKSSVSPLDTMKQFIYFNHRTVPFAF